MMTFFLANMITAVFGSCGFWMSFIFIELIKLFYFFYMSIANVSSFLQISFIFGFSLVTEVEDNKILTRCKIMIGVISMSLIYEYVGVRYFTF